MAKQDGILVDGTIEEALSNGMFRIKLDNGHEALGHVSGKIRMNKIMITEKDRIQISLSPYDLSRGIIKYRYPS